MICLAFLWIERPNSCYIMDTLSTIVLRCDTGLYTLSNWVWNSIGWYANPKMDDTYINSTIPANITEVFSSATSDDGNTLSGAFDIQYRKWSVMVDTYYKIVDKGEPRAAGTFRSLERSVMHSKTEAVEGLVVDTIHGGVGFRNHTVPTGFEDGADWSEDLTWVEPVTSCIDTNLTFLIQITDTNSNISDVSLVDNGGFSDIPRMPPYPDQVYASQDLDLYVRAYKGAWASNLLAMIYFNVSYLGNTGPRNTSKGREFLLNSYYTLTLQALKLSEIDGDFLDLSSGLSNTSALNLSSAARSRLSITRNNLPTAEMQCHGFGGGDMANISNVGIKCGYLLGVPRRVDGTDFLIFEPQTNYTQNLYVCASGLRASIKSVGFSINGTSSLANLRVTSVQDKAYSNNALKPLWAVEKTNATINEFRPLWGLVHDRHESSKELWTLRKEKFWLPTWSAFISIRSSLDSLASTNAFGAGLSEVYKGFSFKSDYSGETNIALNRLWQSYSQSPATAGNIVNLIWTDIIAAAVVGTKPAIMNSASSSQSTGHRNAVSSNVRAQVRRYKPQLRCKLPYAIPAFLSLLLVAILISAALIMWISRRFSLSVLRQLLNQTSTGRAVTNVLYSDLCDPDAPTSEWVEKAGKSRLAFSTVPNETVAGVSGSDDDEHHVSERKPPIRTLTLGLGVSRGEGKYPLYRALSQTDIDED